MPGVEEAGVKDCRVPGQELVNGRLREGRAGPGLRVGSLGRRAQRSIAETLSAEGPRVRRGRACWAPGARSALPGRGSPRTCWRPWRSARCWWHGDHLLGGRARPRNMNASPPTSSSHGHSRPWELAPVALAVGRPAWPSPLAPRGAGVWSRQPHVVARGGGTAMFWRQESAWVRGCLPVPWPPTPLPPGVPAALPPGPRWALCPLCLAEPAGQQGQWRPQVPGRCLLPPTPPRPPSLLTSFLELSCWAGGWGRGRGAGPPPRLGRSRAVLTQTQADPTSAPQPNGKWLMAVALVGPGPGSALGEGRALGPALTLAHPLRPPLAKLAPRTEDRGDDAGSRPRVPD